MTAVDEGFGRRCGDADGSAEVNGVEVAVCDEPIDGASADGRQRGGLGDLHEWAGLAGALFVSVVSHVLSRPLAAPRFRDRSENLVVLGLLPGQPNQSVRRSRPASELRTRSRGRTRYSLATGLPTDQLQQCSNRGLSTLGAGENRRVFGEGRCIAGDWALRRRKIALGGVTGGVTVRCPAFRLLNRRVSRPVVDVQRTLGSGSPCRS